MSVTGVAAPSPLRRSEWLRLARRARFLSWLSLAYMTVEGAVAITAGVLAASPALIGFGIDSAIEGFASLVIVWRFTGSRLASARSEQVAQRLVAIQFFLLGPYVAYEALDSLLAGERPDASLIGIALAGTSLVVMPLLGRAKQRIGERMGSVATRGEGQQNMLCAYLSGALLVGLGANAVLGLWWLDPVAALVIAGVALREGVEAWRGEGCCAPAAPVAGAGAGGSADGRAGDVADCRGADSCAGDAADGCASDAADGCAADAPDGSVRDSARAGAGGRFSGRAAG